MSVGRFHRLVTNLNDYSCACVKEIVANTVCVRPLEKHLLLTTFDTDLMFYSDTFGKPTEMVSSLGERIRVLTVTSVEESEN